MNVPFSKPAAEPKRKWLKITKAAELLCVDVRTIKRWMKDAARRQALGVVMHGKQNRIPLPPSLNGDGEFAWEMLTRYRLKEIGVDLKNSFEVEIEKLAKQNDRYKLEADRLWLAAYIKALKRGRVTQQIRENILLIWQAACKILGSQGLAKYEMDAEKLKPRVIAELRDWGVWLSVKSIMQDWPMAEHFQIVRHAKRLADLEEIRRSLDFWQAYRDESRRLRGKKPSPKNLRLLVHKDLITHINDIRQDPPPGFTVVNNPTPEELEMMTLAGVHDRRQGRRLPYVIISFRQPQPGLSLRTFKSRYPKNKQKPIIFEVDRMLFAPPSLDQSPNGDGED